MTTALAPATHHGFSIPVEEVIGIERLATMMRAIELGVDRDDFVFFSSFERSLWPELELEAEHDRLRLGPTWTIDGALTQ